MVFLWLAFSLDGLFFGWPFLWLALSSTKNCHLPDDIFCTYLDFTTQVLNAINARTGEGSLEYFLPDDDDPTKRKKAVSKDAHKVYLLVSPLPLAVLFSKSRPRSSRSTDLPLAVRHPSALDPMGQRTRLPADPSKDCQQHKTTPPYDDQIGDALSDAPATMEYALKQEAEQILRVCQRIASCMAK